MSAAALFEFDTERAIDDLAAELRTAWVGSNDARYLTVWSQFAPEGCESRAGTDAAVADSAVGDGEWLCEAGWYFGAEDEVALARVAGLIVEAARGPVYYFRDPHAIEHWYWRLRRGEAAWAPLSIADLPAHRPNMDSNSVGYLLNATTAEGRPVAAAQPAAGADRGGGILDSRPSVAPAPPPPRPLNGVTLSGGGE